MYADGVSSKYLEVLLVVYVNLNGCRLAQPGCRVPGWAVCAFALAVARRYCRRVRAAAATPGAARAAARPGGGCCGLTGL